MNVDGMLPFEDEVADYVKETDNHVMYRVTPIYSGDDLVASGVQMEAKSVEDDGAGVTFNVYVYNVQPYVVINYETGHCSYLDKYRVLSLIYFQLTPQPYQFFLHDEGNPRYPQ